MNLAQAPRESSAAPTPATSDSLQPACGVPNLLHQAATAPQALKPSTLDSRPSTPLVILSCGMFYERKNFPGLIQAFNLVAEKYPNVLLRILGDGPDRLKVERERYYSSFRERIELLGKVSHPEVINQMKNADIFALIGWREPFATVFLEAMAAGLPLIACDDGGIAEVIHSADVDAPALDTPQRAACSAEGHSSRSARAGVSDFECRVEKEDRGSSSKKN